MNRIKYLNIITVIAVIGVILSILLLNMHIHNRVHDVHEPEEDKFCNINEQFSCDEVDLSKYSQILGVPVSLIGILGYLALVITAIESKTRKKLTKAIFYLSGIGVLFSIYLTTIEATIIHSFCPLCLASFACILSIFVLSYFAKK